MPAKKRAGASAGARTGGAAGRKENLGARARGSAMQQMIESYPERWEELLKQEREKLGLSADVGKTTRIQKFVAKMRAAGVDENEIQAAMEEAGFVKSGSKGEVEGDEE